MARSVGWPARPGITLMTGSKGWGRIPAQTKRTTWVNTFKILSSEVPDLWVVLDKLDIVWAKGCIHSDGRTLVEVEFKA